MKYLALLPILALSACVDVSDPAYVSDYNGHTVKITDQGGYYPLNGRGQNPKDYPAYQLALQTCAQDGYKDAIYQGVRVVDHRLGTGEHTFLCR